jgi:hypothetical protein
MVLTQNTKGLHGEREINHCLALTNLANMLQVPMGVNNSNKKVNDELSDSSDHDDIPHFTDTESASSNHGGRDSMSKERSDNEADKIAQQESMAVVCIRFIVVFVLILFTVSVSLVVYFFTSKAETREFENQFRDISAKVMEALGSALDRTRGAADALSVILVSYAKIINSTWPFVTLQYTEQRFKVSPSLPGLQCIRMWNNLNVLHGKHMQCRISCG